MFYSSTRNSDKKFSFKHVVTEGLAEDGGLYIPDNFPKFTQDEIGSMSQMNYEEIAFAVASRFIGDEIAEKDLKDIIKRTYGNFTHDAIAPLSQIHSNEWMLELYHGPTLAFKDYALQALGNFLDFFLSKSGKKVVILGATSGDTGSAAIYGCTNCKNSDIFILHPHNKVSEFQRKQMTTIEAGNVFNIALEGSFDDCQNIVKNIFMQREFIDRSLVSVNSINWARIMMQIVYYFYAATRVNQNVSFVVPTGNFGNIYAGYIAKKMGLNVNKFIIATNKNDILTRFVQNNDYSMRENLKSLSPSMDIQISSNLERLLFDLYGDDNAVAKIMADFKKTSKLEVSEEKLNIMRENFDSYSVNDDATVKTIKDIYKTTSIIIDPHTAVAINAMRQYKNGKNYQGEHLIVVSTAHPIKFSESVREAGISIEEIKKPKSYNEIYRKKERFTILPADIDSVKNFIINKIYG